MVVRKRAYISQQPHNGTDIRFFQNEIDKGFKKR